MNTCEWSSSVDQLVEKNTQRPYIKCMVVIFILDHFRGHVLKSSAKSISLLHMIRLYTPTEITDFDDISILDENIFWFDISMDKTLLVQVVNTGAYLNEEIKCSIFTQVLLFTNKIEQITFGSILKRQVDGRFILKRSV